MYEIFIYIWAIFGVNVGTYSIHGASGFEWSPPSSILSIMTHIQAFYLAFPAGSPGRWSMTNAGFLSLAPFQVAKFASQIPKLYWLSPFPQVSSDDFFLFSAWNMLWLLQSRFWLFTWGIHWQVSLQWIPKSPEISPQKETQFESEGYSYDLGNLHIQRC